MRKALRDVQEGRPASCYLFFGDDSFRRERFARTLSRQLAGPTEGCTAEEMDGSELTAGRFAELLDSPSLSFFEVSTRVITIRGFRLVSPNLGAAERVEAERVARRVQRGIPPGTAVVLTVEGEADQKSDLFRALAERGRVFEFAALHAPGERARFAASRLARLDVRATSEALDRLVALCGPDTRTLASEADKLAAYVGPGGTAKPEDVQAVACPAQEARGFDLADAVVERRADAALASARELLRQGEHPLALIALLASRLRSLLHLRILIDDGSLPSALLGRARYGNEFKSAWQEFARQEKQRPSDKSPMGTGDDPASELLQLHPYVAYKTLAAAESYSTEELIHGFEALLRADWALKGEEHLPEAAVLELAILDICQRPMTNDQ